MKLVGLTGGIGSGKSTAASMLAACGATVVDADAIVRELTGAKGGAVDSIEKKFGSRYITPDGSLDRQAMRTLAFTDPAAKQALEEILHPLVLFEATNLAELAQQAQSRCVVFDIPLLVESAHWRNRVHHVLVVDCTEETQINRVMARNGWSREQVQKIIASQATRAQRLAAADFCIYNEIHSPGALNVLVEQAATWFGL